MSAPALRRSIVCALPRLAALKPGASSFSIAAKRWSSNGPRTTPAPPTPAAPAPKRPTSPMGEIASFLSTGGTRSPRFPSASPIATNDAPVTVNPELDPSGVDLQSLTSLPTLSSEDDYHLHVFATKHNTHITFTRPDNGAIIAMSTGGVGFRKGNRGSYDAAYQLASHVFKAIEGKMIRPRSIEVVLRGFGQGREAVVKALLGQEGRALRGAVCRVTDSTRLKFGGTRSKKPRRLG